MNPLIRMIPLMCCCYSSLSYAINEKSSEWSISLGANFANTTTLIGTERPLNGGDYNLSFEENLGLEDSSTIPRIDVNYRFAQRHRILLNYTSLHRTAERKLVTEPFEIDWEGNSYEVQAGAQLNTTLDIDIWRLAYGYDFINNNTSVLGATLGLHIIPLSLEMSGDMRVCIDGDCVDSSNGFLSEEVTAPLPNFGLYGAHLFTPNISVQAHVRYFYLEYDQADGAIIDIALMAAYHFNDQWALGAGYNHLNIEGSWNEINKGKNVELEFSGPSISLNYRF